MQSHKRTFWLWLKRGLLTVDSEELEEGKVITGQKAIDQPPRGEWDNHMRTHMTFRKWCSLCVKGKCHSGAHERVKKSEEELAKELPVISWDYMGQKSKDQKSYKIQSLPILVGVDRKSKGTCAHMVPKKGSPCNQDSE